MVREKVEVADTFSKRLLGLMGKREYEGALVFPLRGRSTFHTFFCRFPIAMIEVERNRVRRVRVVPPWRVVSVEGDHLIELDARGGGEVGEGDVLEW